MWILYDHKQIIAVLHLIRSMGCVPADVHVSSGIRKRGDEYRCSFKKVNGKRIRKSFDSAEDADQWMAMQLMQDSMQHDGARIEPEDS